MTPAQSEQPIWKCASCGDQNATRWGLHDGQLICRSCADTRNQIQQTTVATVPAPSADPKKPMRLLIAGSRTFADYEHLARVLNAVTSKVKARITVICGDAKGADTLGATWAHLNGHDVEHYPANWEVLGRGAGMVRNRAMVATATHACYFWDGKSPGTKHSIDAAKAKGIPIRIWSVDAP